MYLRVVCQRNSRCENQLEARSPMTQVFLQSEQPFPGCPPDGRARPGTTPSPASRGAATFETAHGR